MVTGSDMICLRLCLLNFTSTSTNFGRGNTTSIPYSNTGRTQIWYNCSDVSESTLRKHAYSNILKISPPKPESFQIKKSNIFRISAQNIDCGYSLERPRRGGSNEYPQSMFLSRKKKNNVYPCKHQFYYIKVEFKGVKII